MDRSEWHQGGVREVALGLADVLDLLPDVVLLVDAESRIAFANAAVVRVFGYERDELVGESMQRLVPEDVREHHRELMAEYRETGVPKLMTDRPVLTALHRSGAEIPVSISIANVELGGEPLTVAVIRDAAPVRDQLGRVTSRAETDALTGLSNRTGMLRRMTSLIRAGRSFGVLFLDLTGFKPFNDQYGHATGDLVLQIVAKRLKALVRASDVAARVGGDEFVLVLDGLGDPKDLEARALRVSLSLSQPFRLPEAPSAVIGVSIGGALHPRDGTTEDELMALADRNMYRAKGSQRVYLFGSQEASHSEAE